MRLPMLDAERRQRQITGRILLAGYCLGVASAALLFLVIYAVTL